MSPSSVDKGYSDVGVFSWTEKSTFSVSIYLFLRFCQNDELNSHRRMLRFTPQQRIKNEVRDRRQRTRVLPCAVHHLGMCSAFRECMNEPRDSHVLFNKIQSQFLTKHVHRLVIIFLSHNMGV